MTDSFAEVYEHFHTNIQSIRDYTQYLSTFLETQQQQSLQSMLQRTSLIVVLSYFELLVASLLTVYYQQYPDALRREDKSITIRELTVYSTIEDEVNSVIERQVESILRDDLEGWKYFSNANYIST
jgi:hypothetical protein